MPGKPPTQASRLRAPQALVDAGPLVLGALLLLAAAVLWVAWTVLQPTPDKRLVIATGPADGAYQAFAQRYLPLLQAQGLQVTLRPTQGSEENLALLRDPRSGVHAAFVQGGATAAPLAAASAAERGTVADAGGPKLVSLGSMAIEPLWVFYRHETAQRLRGDTAPSGLAQLAGWRIDTGPEGGGSGVLFRQLAPASGLPLAPLPPDTRADVHGVVDLVQGRVDALVLVSAAEAPLVQYLLSTPGVGLLDFPQAEAYARRFPYLRALRLPRGVVDLAADQPPQEVQLVATTASLAVPDDLHPALVQLLLQAARQAHAQAGWFHRAGDFPQASADELPLAPEAERFYRSGPPWLQSYLPFWLANFVDRMWIVLLPLLAALLPLSRIVPPLVTLRLRSRVYRWYAHLRAVEKALDAPGADLAQLRSQIDKLDAQTEGIGLPLSFTNELYDLRGHIHMVRKRILLRMAPGSGQGPDEGAGTA